MKRLFTTVFAVVALLSAGHLSAHGQGWFGGVFGGVNFLSDADISQASFTNSSGKAEFDTGYMAGGFFGHGFCNGFSLEGEVSYRRNDLDKVTDSGGTAVTVSGGHQSSLALMANARYTFDLFCGFSPYIGAGIGAANVTAKATTTGVGITLDDDDWVFAYQGIGGVEYSVDDAWSLFLEYRYFRTMDPKLTPSAADTAGTYKVENASHSVGVGVLLYF